MTEIFEVFKSLNEIGLSPAGVALIALLWKQDKRITVLETIVNSMKGNREHG
ncbi:hypothetical protein [Vibrio panuliri]|uniref:hypothetical protein n=1 Tax=Vibrio panuliri TaxID=1381081 RepID=UPI000ABBAC87|nr:hypothetical protein [Vibrio panuliri]